MPESRGVITVIEQVRQSPLSVPALTAGAGLWLAFHIEVSWVASLLLAALALVLALALPRLQAGALLATCFLSFFTHGQVAYHHLPEDALRLKGDFDRRTVFLRFQVDEEPRPSEAQPGQIRFPGKILAVRKGEAWEPVSGRMDCRLEVASAAIPSYGEVIEAPVFLRRPEPPRNPGTFDAPRYFRVRHLDYRGEVPAGEWTRTGQAGGWMPVRWALHFRKHMRETLRAGLDDRPGSAALMAAMLFGERDGLSEAQIRQFEVTGTLHLFAVSGQNIQTIAIVMMVILYALGLIRWRWGWLMISPLFLFVISTGMESSAVRAFLMASLVWIAYVLYRPVQPVNVLSAAALLIWIVDPHQLFDLGFQFSFLVVLGLVLLAPPVYRRIYPLLAPDDYLPRRHLTVWRRRLDKGWAGFCALLATSLVAWCCSLPITLLEFHLFSPIAVAANLIVVPLASCVLVLSLASVIAGSLWASLSIPVNLLCALFLEGIVATTEGLSSVPGAYQYVSRHPAPSLGEVRITVPAGYQGLTAWVETAEQTLLIGPGHARDWKYATLPCARYLGIDRADYLILSGATAATIGALPSLEEQMPTSTIVAGNWSSRSPAWKKWEAASARVPVRLLQSSDSWTPLSGPEALVEVACRSLEDQSLMVKFSGPGFRALYLSNPGELTIEWLSAAMPPVDILLVEPGTQRAPLTEELLKKLQPRLIVVPAPGYASSGILTPDLWIQARKAGIEILELERVGAVMIEGRADSVREETIQPEGKI